ncbi:MAG: hypothetical protein JWO05_1402 [Gemmatimonadetes bacterium]|nr:hypothetical protein [Gemmatimonadota bacterium]
MPRFLQFLMVVTVLPSGQALAHQHAADSTASVATASRPDFTWMNGAVRQHRSLLESPVLTGEFRADITWIADFNRPRDHTLVGSSESGRTSEVQVQQLGVGGDLHAGHARGRVMTQFGLYSTMTPRNDASPGRGQWDLAGAYRYLSEAYGGYHWDVLHGVNADAGIFMSYIGLFSYYNFDNWAYQPSYVSSNTPWFFNGLRVQLFVTERLKVEPWLVNGWQSYGSFNAAPGAGLALLWKATDRVVLHSNNYTGRDWLGLPDRRRLHTDNSVQVKYRERPGSWLARGAVSVTADYGCESGAGVSCSGRQGQPRQAFAGFMIYHRAWLRDPRLAITLGGGRMTNPGRYLVLIPPVNGATAFSGTPYFTTNPGDPFRAWDTSATVDVMPDELTTLRLELVHRAASVPYFAGAGGVTPPGGNTGAPGSAVPGFTPDLRRRETRLMLALLVKL